MSNYWAETTQGAQLLELLGSHWASFYNDDGFVAALINAVAEQEKQTQGSFDEAAATLNRSELPLFHTENWYALKVRQSELTSSVVAYGDDYAYGPSLQYGSTVSSTVYRVPKPAGLESSGLIANGISAPSLVWTAGVDFVDDGTSLLLRVNPFDDAAFPKTEIFEDGTLTDFETVLWLFRSTWDRDYLYTHLGYLLDLRLPASANARLVLNTIMDAIIAGATRQHVETLFSALTGIALCGSDGEVVEQTIRDSSALHVVTDTSVYTFPATATAVVAVGDELAAGDALVDTLRFYDLHRGEYPSDLAELAVDKALLGDAYLDNLTFRNAAVDTVVDSSSALTTIRFELGGFPGDVEAFWRSVEAEGVSRGYTLAQLLDTRTPPLAEEPTAATLPTSINPLEFLVSNVFRGNILLVHAKTSQLSAGVGLSWSSLLRMLLPPWQYVIVLVDVAISDAPVSLDGTGQPAVYATNAQDDTVDLSQVEVDASGRCLNCYCR